MKNGFLTRVTASHAAGQMVDSQQVFQQLDGLRL
jgi:hypothetical protein